MDRSKIKRRPLPDSVLKALEPEDKDYLEIDSEKLYFRVRASGSKSWVYRYKRPNGAWAWRGLGSYPGVSGKRAREKARELVKLSNDGIDVHSSQQELTIKKLIELFIEHKVNQGRSANTLKQYRIATNHIYPELGDKLLSVVKRRDCNQLINEIESRGIYASADNVRKTLKQAFSYAVSAGYCEYNPAGEVKHVSVGYTPTNFPYLKEHEIGEFLHAINNSGSHPQFITMLKFLMVTLARHDMVLQMKWSEVDLEKGLWTVPGPKMKGREPHVIPLTRDAWNMLLDWKKKPVKFEYAESPYVFKPVRYTKKTETVGDSTLGRVIFRAGYKDRIVPHGFRH